MSYITLSALNQKIKNSILDNFPEAVWVIAEIYNLSENRNGHCYLELAEKKENSDKVIAKNRAIIWAYNYRMIKTYFEQTTGKKLESGLKVLVKVMPQFHELYSFSLIINDINPEFTLGDLALQRQQTINQLTEDGVIELNKETFLTKLPKNIALISSETAAGYGDFLNQIQHNSNNYAINIELFNAIMQGNTSANSIISQLENIYAQIDKFNAVVILRGGGSKSDLSSFDDYDLALNICHFPLPVITGIGHERDQSIADIVAHTSLKTPTAVAEFLLSLYRDSDTLLASYSQLLKQNVENIFYIENKNLNSLKQKLFNQTYDKFGMEKDKLTTTENKLRKTLYSQFNNAQMKLANIKSRLKNSSVQNISKEQDRIDILKLSMDRDVKHLLSSQKQKLDNLEKTMNLLNPQNLLERGYSLIVKNNKAVKNIDQINENDEITNILKDGEIKSSILKIKKKS